RCAVEVIAAADARREPADPEQAFDRQPTDGDDQRGAQELELPLMPEGPQLPLARCRRAVAAPGRRTSRIAARDRRTVERRVELLLLELEPATQCLAGTAAPGAALLALDDPRCLPVHIGALPGVDVAHGQRIEWVACLDAGPAAGEIPLQRRERPVRAAPARHARTTTNQRPS